MTTPIVPIVTAATSAASAAASSVINNAATLTCAARPRASRVRVLTAIAGLSVAMTIAIVMAFALLTGGRPSYDALGTFRTQNLLVDDHAQVDGTITLQTGIGQPALFTTTHPATADGKNICVGGGCQNLAVDPVGVYTASRNVSFGIDALSDNVSGYNNIAIGTDALQHNIGVNAGLGPNQGHDNVAIGNHAMLANLIGEDNIAIGGGALALNQLSRNSVAIGFQALAASTAQENIAIGTNSMLNMATGTQNIAIGVTFTGATAGNDNIVMGHDSMGSCTVNCNDNVAIGVDVLQNLDSVQNVGIGTFALRVVTGYDNVGIGIGAGGTTTSGHDNTYLGTSTGGGITTGSMNTIVGANVHGLATTTEAKIILSDGDTTLADYIWFDGHAPTSVSHGTLGAGSENTQGNVTGIGANTSTVLTFSNSGFPNHAWCHITGNGAAQVYSVTLSKTAPTISCFDMAGVAANCEDFSYWCSGN